MTPDEIASGMSANLTVDLGGGKEVVIQKITAQGNALRATVMVRQDGASVPFSNPWVIVNPPGTGDTADDIMSAVIQSAGFFNG